MINNKICGLLGLARRAGKLTFGTEACLQEIDKNRVNFPEEARGKSLAFSGCVNGIFWNVVIPKDLSLSGR